VISFSAAVLAARSRSSASWHCWSLAAPDTHSHADSFQHQRPLGEGLGGDLEAGMVGGQVEQADEGGDHVGDGALSGLGAGKVEVDMAGPGSGYRERIHHRPCSAAVVVVGSSGPRA
jgi:hypothetical protein